MNPFTANELLLYYYNELAPASTNAIQIALVNDSSLQQEWQLLQHEINMVAQFSIELPDEMNKKIFSAVQKIYQSQ